MRGQTQVALKAILKYMRSFAASMIQSSGRFYPCAVEFHDGVIKPIEAPDHVDGQLIEYFQQQCFKAVKKSGVTGAAVCFDVWLDDDQAEDGLQMTLFSKDFPQIDLLMSWKLTENGIEYGKVRILSPISVTMTKPIDFYFDFSSPYAYLMARDLTHLAQRQGRDLVWRPILLGAIFRQTGRTPPIDGSARGEYLRHDIERTARRKGLRLNWPAEFPFSSVTAARAFYWLNHSSPKRAQHLAAALMDAIWIEGRALNDPDVLNEVARRLDVDVEAMNQAVQDPKIKALLKQEMDHAMSQNVFGSPWVVVDGEPFWGNDRLDDIQHWLQTGGF